MGMTKIEGFPVNETLIPFWFVMSGGIGIGQLIQPFCVQLVSLSLAFHMCLFLLPMGSFMLPNGLT
jgi:heme/copper-type cytochrome/quinol oxidase subunit 4